MKTPALLASLLALALTSPLAAQTDRAAPSSPIAKATDTEATVPGNISGEIEIRGATYRYEAEVGERILRKADGTPLGTMSYTSYVVPAEPTATRAVTFLFNGGPLVATVALREGVGPVRTVAGDQRGSFRYEANSDSLLDQSDLVFIDAPGTGYGRFFSGSTKANFWGVQQDRGAFSDFIQDWLRANKRERSPVFLMGESYGGLRAALLAPVLADKVHLRGIALVSPASSAGEIGLSSGIEPAVINLPTQAAVARFHGRGRYNGLTVEQVAVKAYAFANGRYADALRKGDALPARQMRALADEVSGFTGIPADTILKAKLRIEEFGDLLIAGERVGHEDGRAHAPLAEVVKLPPPFDQPDSTMYRDTYDRIFALDSWFRYGFRYRPKGPFVYLSLEANRAWDWTVADGSIYAAEEVKTVFDHSRDFRLFLMAGYFDAATPFGGSLAAYSAARLPSSRFLHKAYESGHAIFSDDNARTAATDDLRRWYQAGGEGTP